MCAWRSSSTEGKDGGVDSGLGVGARVNMQFYQFECSAFPDDSNLGHQLWVVIITCAIGIPVEMIINYFLESGGADASVLPWRWQSRMEKLRHWLAKRRKSGSMFDERLLERRCYKRWAMRLL